MESVYFQPIPHEKRGSLTAFTVLECSRGGCQPPRELPFLENLTDITNEELGSLMLI